jgi:hypothetical protein
MHPLRRRGLDHRDLVHHLVHDLEFLVRHQLLDLLNDMDCSNLVHLFRCAVDIVNRAHLLDVEKMDALQNLDEQNLDEVQPFQVVVHLLLDELADAELRHWLKMDYFQDVVDAEQRFHLKMDYFQDVVPVWRHRLPVLHQYEHQRSVTQREQHLLQQLLRLRLHVMLLTQRDQRQVRRRAQRRERDLLQRSSLRQPSLRQPF